jgi:hypothetical protein
VVVFPGGKIMKTVRKKTICLNCYFFRNNPKYLEKEYKGLTTLSSAYGSVRKDDGICMRHDEYLSAYDFCDQFQAC